jgi:L-iditol 2-dehydrogenase
MKALSYTAFEQLEIRDEPPPEAASGEVVLRVAACGLCGSELESFRSRSPRRQPPIIMGHEFCGMIESVGPGCDPGLLGRRFVSNSLVSCGRCARCSRGDTHLCKDRRIFGMHRPGAFAELVRVPVRALIPWPDELPAQAACLAEPLANGVHVANLTRHLPARTALIIGAGPIGLMCQQALQAIRGTTTLVCDLSIGRLEIARKLGANDAIDARTGNVENSVVEWTSGEGVDLVVDAAGSETTKRLSIAALRPGGAAVWIGLHDDTVELETYAVTLPEKQILGTYAAKVEELADALQLMKAGRVDVTSWTTAVPLDQAVPAFLRMLNPGEHDIKALFMP